MMLTKSLPLLFLLATSAFGAKHYSYTSTGRTVSEIQPRAAAAALTDFTTHIGDGYVYQVAKIATDAAGSTYITGSRWIPVGPSLSEYHNGVFVSKIDRTGSLVFTATFSGKLNEWGSGIALDPAGNIYVAGLTTSVDFPLRRALQKRIAGTTGFILKLSNDGSQLIYSTFFGGTGGSSASAIAVDADGNAYIGGSTSSSDFPSSAALRYDSPSISPVRHSSAYVAKVSPSGDRIVFAGVFGGSARPCTGSGSSCVVAARESYVGQIALDSVRNIYIAGYTNVTDFPTTTGALMGPGGLGAFVTKIKTDGSGLAYSTYLGSQALVWQTSYVAGNTANALAVDANGYAYVVGSTSDPKFPFTTGTPPTGPNAANAFVAKLHLTGTGVVWATYLTAQSTANSIALESDGSAWLTGVTESAKFPNKNGWTADGPEFLVKLNASGSALDYSARYPLNTVAQDVAIDHSGQLHLAGSSGLISTLTYPTTSQPHVFGVRNVTAGNLSGIISPSELISITGSNLGPAKPLNYTLDANGRVPTRLGGVRVSIGGTDAPLLYVSGNEIQAMVPRAIPGDTATLSLSRDGVTAPDFDVLVVPSMPGIFRNTGGFAAALNQDGTPNSQSNPAKVGSIVSIWVTGVGAAPGPDGTITKEANSEVLCCYWTGVRYAGPAPGMVSGIWQVNFSVAELAAPGDVTQLISLNSDTAPASASIFVKP